MIDFEQAYETIPGNGWLSKEEARHLWDYASRETGPILEVGCYKGRSTCLLAQLGRTMYCVDPFEGFSDSESATSIHAEFVRNLVERDHFFNPILFISKIEDWEHRPVGFAYLDGDHSYEGTLGQIKAALLCGARTIAIHDYSNSEGGRLVKRAATETLGAYTEKVQTMAIWVRS